MLHPVQPVLEVLTGQGRGDWLRLRSCLRSLVEQLAKIPAWMLSHQGQELVAPCSRQSFGGKRFLVEVTTAI